MASRPGLYDAEFHPRGTYDGGFASTGTMDPDWLERDADAAPPVGPTGTEFNYPIYRRTRRM